MPLSSAQLKEGRKEEIFTDDQIANLTGFFDVLKKIHTRLAIEGYVITPEGIQAPTTRSFEAALVPTT